MNMKTACTAIALALACVGSLSGCAVAGIAATAAADAQQKPPTSTYAFKAPAEKVYKACALAMGELGQIVSQDASTGTVQGKKGNWLLTATAADSTVKVSARYVPSNQMDFNSRDGLTKQFVSMLEASLGVPAVAAAQ